MQSVLERASLRVPQQQHSKPLALRAEECAEGERQSLQKQFINKQSRPRDLAMLDTCACSMNLTPQPKSILAEQFRHHGKKRIGAYSYHLNDRIGSGFSSHVFKGYKNDNRQEKYAIKVINLSRMSKSNYSLLRNEISILKQLSHPNILQLHQVFYTANNCYIVADYCESGTLQSHIESNTKLDWREVFQQLVEGCRYLENNLVIHRDIKPANIFLKGKQWKIGDFGFARYVPYKTAQIKQLYMIGSPLYMPPQTLQKNIYSLKTDSFALGVLFFHLVTKSFPWSGNNKRELIENYANKQYPLQKINKLPDYLQQFLKGLCEIQIGRRLWISDLWELKQNGEFNASNNVFGQQESLVQEFSHEIVLDVVEKMKLCKFILYININIQHFPQMCEISQSLRRMLKFLVLIFNWTDNESFTKYLQQFMCLNYRQFCRPEQLSTLYSHLQISIDALTGTEIRRCQILRIKLIQLADILRRLIYRDFNSLTVAVRKLVLHADFSKVLISPLQIEQIQMLRHVDA